MFINANLCLPILTNAIVFYECNDKNFKRTSSYRTPFGTSKDSLVTIATLPLCHFATLPLRQSSSTMVFGFHCSQTSHAYKNWFFVAKKIYFWSILKMQTSCYGLILGCYKIQETFCGFVRVNWSHKFKRSLKWNSQQICDTTNW